MTAILSPETDERPAGYRSRVRAWILYDWANSAFVTTVTAALLPFYYSQVAGSTLPSASVATQYWSITLSISVLIVALISPILGTMSDIRRSKKRFLSLFTILGVGGAALLALVGSGDWVLASLVFIVGRVGFGGAIVFYDSLLPHVAVEEDQDRVSAQGYAIGYLGGGLLLAINVVMVQTLPDTLGVRLSFLSVAVWWLLFSIPIFRRVPEPPAAAEDLPPGKSVVRASFGRIAETLRRVRRYGELFQFLIAYLIYNDGIGVIISMAAIYVAELGFGLTEAVLAILLIQFVGIPYSLIFGSLPGAEGARKAMFAAFVIANLVLLPVVGVGSRFLLPAEITGRPSAPFEAQGEFVGQGLYEADDAAFNVEGDWTAEAIDVAAVAAATENVWERALRVITNLFGGEEQRVVYTITDSSGARLDLPFHGQGVEVTYSAGPDRGIWAVLIDGEPLLEEGEPVLVDAYQPTVRFGVTETFLAEDEGLHTLALVNTGERNPESAGTVVAVGPVQVEAPRRTSNLGAILGLIVVVQIVTFLFARFLGPTLFSGLAASLDTKRSIMLSLVVYSVIAVWGFFLNAVIEFWFLAWMVAIVQGGSQALSRSLYASLSPNALSGEFFGLFSIMSKFASFLSPLVFAAAVAIYGSSRPGILSIVIFFVIGLYLLSRVDVEEGRRVARLRDAELLGEGE